MGASAMSRSGGFVTKAADKRECIVLIVGLLLVLLSLSRYIVNGEPVDIRSDEMEAALRIPLSDGMEIRQPLTITEEMNWRQGYYALLVAECDGNSAGKIICTLEQGKVVGTAAISLREMAAGEWIRLKELDFGELECGEAVLCLSTEGVSEGEFAVAAGPDYYGFGIMDVNGAKQGSTLAQAYHYHITGTEYKVRLLCYGVVALCALALVLLAGGRHIESGGRCVAVFGVMTVLFMAMIYVLDSSIYLEPAYAEAVTNFMQYAREEKLAANLLITDAGYLPLLPRLITLFYVKVLRLPSAYVLYFMQITASLLCSMVWSFFVLSPFRKTMRLSGRILWCILVMMTCFYEETLFFTNHAYWGIYLLLLMLVADLRKFPKWIYAGLLVVSALICLSKGTYAVMLPLMILYLIFFRKSVGIREKVFACVVSAASFLQLLYSFSGQGDGSSWIGADSMGQIGYWFRLCGRVFAEFGGYLLLPLGRSVERLSGLILVLALAVFIFLVVDFTGKVLIPVIKGKMICRERIAFYAVVMFQLIVSAFYLVTVKPVPDAWNDIGKITFGQMGHKYEIFSDIGFYMLLLTGAALFKQEYRLIKKMGRGDEAKAAIIDRSGINDGGACYGILILLAVFCLTNPVMELTGWADAAVSDGRQYAGDINAGWWDHKDMIAENAFFIPVRADYWGYGRNSTVYQVGTDDYFEEVSVINMEETLPEGYHSEFEIQDVMQVQNLIEVMIRYPARIDRPVCQAQLLDGEGNVTAESRQIGSGRNKKCLFRFANPVSDVKTIRFTDEDGNPVYYKDYVAWVCAW